MSHPVHWVDCFALSRRWTRQKADAASRRRPQPPEPSEHKCLIRVVLGNKKISTVVSLPFVSFTLLLGLPLSSSLSPVSLSISLSFTLLLPLPLFSSLSPVSISLVHTLAPSLSSRSFILVFMSLPCASSLVKKATGDHTLSCYISMVSDAIVCSSMFFLACFGWITLTWSYTIQLWGWAIQCLCFILGRPCISACKLISVCDGIKQIYYCSLYTSIDFLWMFLQVCQKDVNKFQLVSLGSGSCKFPWHHESKTPHFPPKCHGYTNTLITWTFTLSKSYSAYILITVLPFYLGLLSNLVIVIKNL